MMNLAWQIWPGQIHHQQLHWPAEARAQQHTLCDSVTSNYFGRKLDTIPVHPLSRHSAAQHSTARHSTAQHSTAQLSTAQHSTAQHSTAQHSTASLIRAKLNLCSVTCVKAMQSVEGCQFCQHAHTVTSRYRTIHS